MLPPLDSRVLSALVRDGDYADSEFLGQAKSRLNKDRNLCLGVLLLLWTYGRFLAQLYQDKAPLGDNRKGADSWNIQFRDPPFNSLRIHSTSVEGVIDIHVLNKPFLSIWIFDRPQNWQAMLQWLWEYGDRCEIARSIPQLDPRRMRTLVEGSDGPNNGDKIDTSWKKSHSEDDDDLSIGAARRALVIGDIGEGMYKMLLAFHIFEPFVHWDKAFICHADVGHERWHISFLVSPFRSLRLQPGDLEGVVYIYAFDKLVKSLPMTESPQSWQAFLEWLWDYGNQRHIAKAEYEASLRRLNTTTKSQSKRQHAQKPLLHQVLRTASFKAQRGPKMKPKKLAHMTKAADTVMDSVDGMPTPRPALHPADPNGQIGKSEQVPSTTADDGAKHLTMRSRAW